MQEGKVKIADGLPETRARLENFKSKMKLESPSKKITMGDAIEFAITQAEKVPVLEARIKELEACSICGSTFLRLTELNKYLGEQDIDSLINRLMDERDEDIILSGGEI